MSVDLGRNTQPGDEPIEEFLAMLEGDAKRRARRARNKDAPKSGGRKR
jgi:hypothetical protein